MNIDEGWTDTYRELVSHGGIPDSNIIPPTQLILAWFWSYLAYSWGRAIGDVEDLGAETKEHPFYDSFWQTKTADFSKITQPVYIVAGWPYTSCPSFRSSRKI